MQVYYSAHVAKAVKKHQLPKEVWEDFRDAFEALAASRNFRLFDIKKMMIKGPYVYFRLRVRQYRALFHVTSGHIYVEEIGPRGEIYRRWR